MAVEQTPAPHRTPDGKFAPGHPGKPHGAISKHKRKLRELVEAEVDGDPLPVKMARIGKRAEDTGDDALALTAYVAAAQYIYGKLKPREEVNEHEGTGLERGLSYKIVGLHEDPTPDSPGQRVLIDPTRHPEDGVVSDKAWSDDHGELRRVRFLVPGTPRHDEPGTIRIDFNDAQ